MAYVSIKQTVSGVHRSSVSLNPMLCIGCLFTTFFIILLCVWLRDRHNCGGAYHGLAPPLFKRPTSFGPDGFRLPIDLTLTSASCGKIYTDTQFKSHTASNMSHGTNYNSQQVRASKAGNRRPKAKYLKQQPNWSLNQLQKQSETPQQNQPAGATATGSTGSTSYTSPMLERGQAQTAKEDPWNNLASARYGNQQHRNS